MNKIIKESVVKILHYSKVISPKFLDRNSYSILTFHRVLPIELKDQYFIPNLVVTPEDLFDILSYCKKHYQCGSIKETMHYWNESNKPKKPLLAITFDDGQKDNHEYALPVLEKVGLKATFFISTNHINESSLIWHDVISFLVGNNFDVKSMDTVGFINNILDIDLSRCDSGVSAVKIVLSKLKELPERDRLKVIDMARRETGPFPEWAGMMTWGNVREISEFGHEIGSHTLSHPILSQCSDQQLEREISMSKTILEDRLNVKVETLCYPNGDFDNRVINAAKNFGYKRAVTTRLKMNKIGDPIFSLGRFDMNPSRLKSYFDRNELSIPWLSWRLSSLKNKLSSMIAGVVQ